MLGCKATRDMKAEIFYHDFQDTNCLMFGTPAKPEHYYTAAKVNLSDDYRASEPEAVCDLLFRQFNIGDHGGLNVRSMSVGDKIRLEGRGTWICKPKGWGLIK